MWGINSKKIIKTLLILSFYLTEYVSPLQSWPSTDGLKDKSSGERSVTLFFKEESSTVVRSHCDSQLALYMGQWILLTWSLFEDSNNALAYVGPDDLKGSVSSAAFVLDNLAIVIDERLYIYSLNDQTWTHAKGVTSPVTSVSSLQCCFSKNKACLDVSSTVLLYSLGSPVEYSQVYMSTNGGFVFVTMSFPHIPDVFIGGFFNMPTVSSIVEMITNNQSMFSFRYISDTESLQSEEQPMNDPLDNFTVIQPPGMRGQLLIWSPNMLLYSPNHGVVILPVLMIEEEKVTLPPENVTILQVATAENGVMAVMTSDGALYYGRMGLDVNTIKFSLVLDTSKENLMLFTDYGDLVLIEAHEGRLPGVIDFDQKSIIIQQELTRTSLSVPTCPVEQFYGSFDGDHFYIDMHCTVTLSAIYIPSPLCTFFPLVTVTNSKDLSFKEVCMEDGITQEGTKKYRLDITLHQLDNLESEQNIADPNDRKDSLSTITVDLMGRNVTCKDLNPLKAHILIGCPPEKHIRIGRNVTACTKGTFSQEQLQDNFTYLIPKEVYDPKLLFRPNSAPSDMLLNYSVPDYLCPLLVYHDMPWIPTLQLWEGDRFVENVKADFVLFEINGMYNYRYRQSAQDSKCVCQPQNWTSQLAKQSHPDPHTAWNRENYVDCHDSIGLPLTEPTVQYQVLNRKSGNKVVFPNYNGIYIFKAIVVDPSYSYCHLTTTFSVFVYGAFPPHPLPTGIGLSICMAIMILLLLSGFVIRQHSFKG